MAHFQNGVITVWTHSQRTFDVRRVVAELVGLPLEKVHAIHVEGSGCYGQNGADDVDSDAALIARDMPDRPIRLQWMREQEFGWEPLGPGMLTELDASLYADKRIVSWNHEVWSNPHNNRPVGAGGGRRQQRAGGQSRRRQEPDRRRHHPVAELDQPRGNGVLPRPQDQLRLERLPGAAVRGHADAIEVHVMDRPGLPFLGTAEAAQGPAAAAFANAVADAAGLRLRNMPLSPERIKAALGAISTRPSLRPIE